MGEKKERFRGENFRRQRWQEKAAHPVPQFPEGSKLSIKNLGYLYSNCRLSAEDIAKRYPKALTLADVFAGLAEYLKDRERYDSEIKRDLQSNSQLNSASGLNASLPRVGLSSLVSPGD